MYMHLLRHDVYFKPIQNTQNITTAINSVRKRIHLNNNSSSSNNREHKIQLFRIERANRLKNIINVRNFGVRTKYISNLIDISQKINIFIEKNFRLKMRKNNI